MSKNRENLSESNDYDQLNFEEIDNFDLESKLSDDFTEVEGEYDLLEDDENTNEIDEEPVESDSLKTFDEIVYDDFEKKLSDVDITEYFGSDIVDVESLTIEDAIQDYKDGHEEAFNKIYENYAPKLERLGRRKNNDELPLELAEVLFKAVKTYRVDCNTKFNTYFWRCARNAIGAINIRNNAKKRTAEHGVISMQQSFNMKESEVLFESFVEDRTSELRYDESNFKMMLEKNIYPYLKPSEIKAIKMLLAGYTLDEIGQALGGITAPAVHVKLRRLPKKKNIGKQLKMLFENYCV